MKAAGFDLASDFDAVVPADGFPRLKPDPALFLAAAERIGVDPAACVVIEDAPAGVAAARAAGMRVVGVTSTLSRAQMEALGPDKTVGGPADLDVPTLTGLQTRQGVVAA